MNSPRRWPYLDWIVTLILALGILPSYTALSAEMAKAWPHLVRFTGPLNPLKITLPLLLLYIWTGRKQIAPLLLKLSATAFLIGSVSTVIAAERCGFAPTVIREWAVMINGALAAACFILLPSSRKKTVVVGWTSLIFTAVALDLLHPSVIDWLYLHLFDPQTPVAEIAQGQRLLSGVWGNQSLAKLLSWLPWLGLAIAGTKDYRQLKNNGWFFLAVISTGLIFQTSQRGPFLGAVLGWGIFALHQFIRFKNRSTVVATAGALIISVLMTVTIAPKDMLQARVKSAVGLVEESDIAIPGNLSTAIDNIRVRKALLKLSLQRLPEHPLGDACIPPSTYSALYIPVSHSHHMFLQQFRDRGWIWGLFHLGLWIMAFFGAWQSKHPAASALAAGIGAVMIQGQFDHPWFVLNHAMILGIFLISGLSLMSTAWTLKQK